MLKHMLNTTANGSLSTRQPSSVVRPDSSIIMDQSHRSYRTSAPSTRLPTHQQSTILSASSQHCDLSKNSIYSNAVLPPGNKSLNGGLNISRVRNQSTVNKFIAKSKQVGVKEMLVSLGLLCLVSLLLALLSLIFLLKISPVTASEIRELLRSEQLTVITAEEYVVVYEVTLALCALTLSLNLCCLLVCAIQFLFAVKLVKSPHGGSDRTNKYLQKSSVSRICAVGGFFISIPIFLTGIILYTFIQFHSTPAIVTSVFIGLGIVFCGCAMVHNVFIWQREKTNAVKELALAQHDQSFASIANNNQSVHCMAPLNQSVHSIAPPLNQTLHSIGAPLNQSLHSVGALNQSHISHHFHPSSFGGIRPSTTTPTNDIMINKRDASGSVSPCMPNVALELSSVATTNSPHELSTLV